MKKIDELHQNAKTIGLDARSKYLRRSIIKAAEKAGQGHIGGAFSAIEIIRVLYDDILSYTPDDPSWEGRDRFILSKGHGCLALYAILADKCFFPKECLDSCFKKNSILGGHPERGKIPGVEASTGSLGHGLSIGVGMAIALRIKKQNNRVFVLLSDGENEEGSVWEAALSASKHRLSNLTAIIDYNKVQASGFVKDILNLEPLAEKWKSFGFETIEINGHDLNQLGNVLRKVPLNQQKPTALICHTIKGKGIPFIENDARWHYKKVDGRDASKLYEFLGADE